MFRNIIRLSRPLYLVFTALTYFFGASIANYLGKPFIATAFWLGLAGALLVQLTMSLLAAVFRLDLEPLFEGETRRGRQLLRNNALYISIASLASATFIVFVLYFEHVLTLIAFLFLFLSLLLVLVYSLPPFRNRGFDEFILASHLSYVIPSLAYVLQAGETHRFLILAIPLTLLAFAYFVVMDFPTFLSDEKLDRVTLLTRLGWERVVPLHHLILLSGYLLFAIMSLFGLPLSFIWPAFLTLPFALFQIYQLRTIAMGAQPNWTLLTATALAVFVLTAYFLTLTFWLR